IAISGILQNKYPSGTGWVAIGGAEQSGQGQNQPPTPPRLSVTIGGSDLFYFRLLFSRGRCHTGNSTGTRTIAFSVNVGGTMIGPVQTSYNGTSTTASLAAGLYASFPTNSLITMSNPNGSSSFTLTTTATGVSTNNTTFSTALATSCVNSSTVEC